MNKKTGLQATMVLVIVIITLWFYLKYFTKNFEDIKDTPIIEKVDENQNSDSTYINDINYVSTDIRGNKYQITAKLAEIKIENSDVMFLTDVIAFIFIKDKDTVKIISNFGKYNTIKNNLQDLSVKKVMTKNPVSINQDTLAEKALSIMNAKKITSLCVHKGKNTKKTVGILHIHNILKSNIH